MLSDRLYLNDVTLRDGIQNESRFMPFAIRLALVEALIHAGIRNIQLASFVNPLRVPQMRDIEAFIDRVPNKQAVTYSGLVLNEKGLARLKQTQLNQVDISISCSNPHSIKNTGLTVKEAQQQALAMIDSARKIGLSVRVGLQCVFGCHHQGEVTKESVLSLLSDLINAGCNSISLADSTGQALPQSIKSMVESVLDMTQIPLILHLHDTLGLGIANFIAGYEAGVRSFDVSLGGIGGCPFIPGAAGNIALEDIVHLSDRLGIETEVSLTPLTEALQILQSVWDRELPGKIHKLLLNDKIHDAAYQQGKGSSYGTDSLGKNSESKAGTEGHSR